MFALNPAMPNLHRLYQAGARPIVHAAATPYRERRISTSGWCSKAASRVLARLDRWLIARRALEPAGSANPARSNLRNALKVGPIAPGRARPAPVLSWTPPRLPPASDDTAMRLLDLYRHARSRARARPGLERMGLAEMRAA